MRNIKQNKKIIKPKTGLGKINKITKNQDGKSKHQNGQ